MTETVNHDAPLNNVENGGKKSLKRDPSTGIPMFSCIKSVREIPSKKMTIRVDDATSDACKKYAADKGESMSSVIGEMIENAVKNDFKPFGKDGAPEGFKIDMNETDKRVYLMIHESNDDKLKTMARRQNLSTGDYIRIILSAVLIDKTENF